MVTWAGLTVEREGVTVAVVTAAMKVEPRLAAATQCRLKTLFHLTAPLSVLVAALVEASAALHWKVAQQRAPPLGPVTADLQAVVGLGVVVATAQVTAASWHLSCPAGFQVQWEVPVPMAPG